METQNNRNRLPVRIYLSGDLIMVATPMPGLEPENISVIIAGDRVILRGEERGPRQHERDLLAAEWTVGPYEREIVLPHPVDGALTNATYGNGVLALSMPRRQPGQPATDTEFTLEVIEATRGEHVGHAGRALRPSTTREHRQMRDGATHIAGARLDEGAAATGEVTSPALTLTEAERQLLIQLLQAEVPNLRSENYRAETHRVKELLKSRESLARQLLERLERSAEKDLTGVESRADI